MLEGDIQRHFVLTVFESQRRYPISGWSDRRLPDDRPQFSTETGAMARAPADVDAELPAECHYTDVAWNVVVQPGTTDSDGWQYALDFGLPFGDAPTRRTWVRRRRWQRHGTVSGRDTEYLSSLPSEFLAILTWEEAEAPIVIDILEATQRRSVSPAIEPPMSGPLAPPSMRIAGVAGSAAAASASAAAAAPAAVAASGPLQPPAAAAPPFVKPLQLARLDSVGVMSSRDVTPRAGAPMSGQSTPRMTQRSARAYSRASRAPSMASARSAVSTAEWMKDNESQNCIACARPFTFTLRRHHCRVCGILVCRHCCREDAEYGGLRVCVLCKQEDAERLEEEQRLHEELEELDRQQREHEAETRAGQAVLQQLEQAQRAEIAADSDGLLSLIHSVGYDERAALRRVEALRAGKSPADGAAAVAAAQAEADLDVSDAELGEDEGDDLDATAVLARRQARPARSGVLFVTVLGATGLQPFPRLDDVSAKVLIKYKTQAFETPVVPKSKRPIFDHSVTIAMQDDTQPVEFTLVECGFKVYHFASHKELALATLRIRDQTHVQRHRPVAGCRREEGTATLALRPASRDAPELPKTAALSVRWSLEIREGGTVERTKFCDNCGHLQHRCVCETHAEGAAADAAAGASPAMAAAVAAEAALAHRPRTAMGDAIDRLFVSRFKRLEVEQRVARTNIVSEERALFTAMRDRYFADTVAAKKRSARREKQRAGFARLRTVGIIAARSLAGLYVSLWHDRTVANADARRLRLQRLRILELQQAQQQAARMKPASPVAPPHATVDEVVSADAAAAAAKKNKEGSKTEAKKSKSSKCCSLM